jgi:pteridine reductase
MEIKGKTALVTGAARRLGKATALELARRGAHIALHYFSAAAQARQVRRQILKYGVQCRLYKANLAQATAVESLAKKVLRDWGGCQILVNTAAIYPQKEYAKASRADYDMPYAVNLRAPALLSARIGHFNKKNKIRSRIVHFADVGGELPWTGYIPYTLSKAGVLQLTRASAKDLAPWVLVNSISPGPMLPGTGQTAAGRRDALKRTLLKKYGGADEITRTVVFMIESDFMTGSNVVLDGGRMLAEK